MKIFTLILSLFFFVNTYAQDHRTKALDQVATCGALSYVSTAIYVPIETIEKITAFDSETKKYLKNDQVNLKKVSDAFALRAVFFNDLYFDMAKDSRLTNGQYKTILESKYLELKKSIINDGSFAVNLGKIYPKCQAYIEAMSQISIKDRAKYTEISVKLINEISRQNFVANENQVGLIVIAGLHWKHMDFIRAKSIDEFLKLN